MVPDVSRAVPSPYGSTDPRGPGHQGQHKLRRGMSEARTPTCAGQAWSWHQAQGGFYGGGLSCTGPAPPLPPPKCHFTKCPAKVDHF